MTIENKARNVVVELLGKLQKPVELDTDSLEGSVAAVSGNELYFQFRKRIKGFSVFVDVYVSIDGGKNFSTLYYNVVPSDTELAEAWDKVSKLAFQYNLETKASVDACVRERLEELSLESMREA